MSYRLRATFLYVCLAVSVISAGVFTYWNFQPSNALDIMNNPAPVRPKEINPEATVIVSPILCKRIEARATVRRTLISKSSKILLPDYGNYLPVGCSRPQLPVIIPSNVPDGTYHLEYQITYSINPIKDDVEYWWTQEFQVRHIPPLVTDDSAIMIETQTTPAPSSGGVGASALPAPAIGSPATPLPQPTPAPAPTPSMSQQPPTAPPTPLQQVMSFVAHLLRMVLP